MRAGGRQKGDGEKDTGIWNNQEFSIKLGVVGHTCDPCNYSWRLKAEALVEVLVETERALDQHYRLNFFKKEN